jgi:chromosome segregation ATPase
MSSGDLSKKEEVELSAQINKIGRIRADTTRNIPADAPQVDTSGQVAVAEAAAKELREAVDKHRVEKEKLVAQKEEVDWKIHCIREDLTQFIAEIKQIAEEEESNEQSKALYDQSKALKQQIYDLREQIAQAEKDFKEKTQEYEYEQEKIRWTAWATKIQEERREEWEAEKAERKRQKLREKEKGDGKKEGDGKTTE